MRSNSNFLKKLSFSRRKLMVTLPSMGLAFFLSKYISSTPTKKMVYRNGWLLKSDDI